MSDILKRALGAPTVRVTESRCTVDDTQPQNPPRVIVELPGVSNVRLEFSPDDAEFLANSLVTCAKVVRHAEQLRAARH